MNELKSIEICAGAGGQALGLENAGFKHEILIEIDHQACQTLKQNRINWKVLEMDVKNFIANDYKGIDLLAGGVPCPPFSVAGNQLGENDERDLFPEMIRLISECNPKAVMIENVKGLFDDKFKNYRNNIKKSLNKLGYQCFWDLFNAADFGVPQKRERTILVALKPQYSKYFRWPKPKQKYNHTVGSVLFNEMNKYGWKKSLEWSKQANTIAPTLVGGSKKHGGPDLGPTRSKIAWAKLGVDGSSIADSAPHKDFEGKPKLTIKMTSIIQGFPDIWSFYGSKTAAYRQIGNAFPPPIAESIGLSVFKAIKLGIETERSKANARKERLEVETQRVLPAACGPIA